MVRMKDVAKHAGVSVATVSNVVTGKQYVSDEVKANVLNSIKALNYKVNLVARGLKSKRTFTVGVILPDITKMFFPDVLKGIMDSAQKADYNINFLSSGFDFEVEKNHVEFLKSSCVDGIIIDTCCKYTNQEAWEKEIAFIGDGKRLPVVSIETYMNINDVSSLLVDNYNMAKGLTNHLVSLGRRRIIYIVGIEDVFHEHDRFEGHKGGLAENGLPYRQELIYWGDFSAMSGYVATKKAIESGVEFDAIQAANDQSAIGALKALLEADLRCPEDIAVTGFDNIFPGTLVSPQITTVDVPRYKLGYDAFNELKRLIDDEDAKPQKIIIDSKIIVRNSTCPDCYGEWNLANW